MHPIRTFIRHYIEMILAMLIGMMALGMLAGTVLGGSDSAAVVLAEMGVAMATPMVAWMRFRGHGWRATGEMIASMLLATLGTLALLGAGLVTGTDTLLAIEHVVMLPSMLTAMLLRRDQYTGRGHQHHPVAA